MTTQPSEVIVERFGSILVISIDRPQQRNAMTRAAATAIAGGLDELDRDAALQVGILTGRGGTFCSGMDLKGFLRGEVSSLPDRGFGGLTQRPPTKPLIAAVEGYAVAGGFELVLACDLVVAGESAKFGLPEVKRGLVARAGGLFRLPDRLPRAVALELILTGDLLGATEANRLGLVNRVVNDGGALDEAKGLATTIALNAPMAITASKLVVNESRSWSESESFDRQLVLTDPVFASEDAKEGARAFAEKRPAQWMGR